MQEWVVDAAAAIEQMQLSWITTHQADFRSETFSNLRSAVEDGQPLCHVGVRTLLPSTHTGSPRYMYQSYHDCMAIVRHHGKPSLFITMTSNWNWRELRESLGPGQQPSNRPDLMARVFRLKLDALLDDLTRGAVFGTTVAHTYVVEYQKRGLPHAHILLILSPQDRPVTAADVDSMTCAELPDEATQPELWATVTSSMLHGPCGAANPSCICMRNGRCKSGYPRRFQETTLLGEDGYPVYRRRNNGKSFTRNNFVFNNQWVVPYNPWLCAKYDCHINVEIASAIGAVKYLYKYVYKGNDRSAILLHDPTVPVNEINDYLDARRISPAEACYNIFSFQRSGHLPVVTRLSVHLPGQNMVRFRPTAEARATLRQVKPSSLEAFFQICREQPDLTRDLLYPDAPTVLTWHKQHGRWGYRQQAKTVIGRVLFVPPAQGEVCLLASAVACFVADQKCFYLRMLLYHVPSPSSYESLRTVNGNIYPTFKLACKALGLLDDDKEHDECLSEAALFHTAHALRMMFVAILIHSTPMDPNALYARHKADLFDDCLRALQHPPFQIEHPSMDEIEELGLSRLAALAAHHGRTLPELGLPPPPVHPLYQQLHSALREERQYDKEDLAHEVEAGLAKANTEQQQAFNLVMEAVHHASGQLFFLDGPGGTGKTFVERLCLAQVRAEDNIALAVASSGVAALLLPGGRTAHSRFKIPINTTPSSVCSVPAQSSLAQLFRDTSLIVWDEAVMQHLDCLMAVDRMLQDIRDCQRPFGGITILFAGEGTGGLRFWVHAEGQGDLRQCLPVIPKGGRTDIINSTITNAPFWRDTRTIRLQQNMRLANAPRPAVARAFAAWLLSVGDASANGPDGKTALLQEHCLACESSHPDLISAIYPALQTLDPQNFCLMAGYFAARVILAPHNASVEKVNHGVLQDFPGRESVCLSADRADLEDGTTADLPGEYLNTLDIAGFPAHRLCLKQGAPIILLRNLAPADGLCNGTRLIVLSVGVRVLQCRVLTGPSMGNVVLIPRIRLANNPGGDLPFTLHRTQFPVRLAFAMTINKAQGQSLSEVGLDLTLPCFGHGQLYVGLSRATSPGGLHILLPGDASHCVPNVVYREVLLAAGL